MTIYEQEGLGLMEIIRGGILKLLNILLPGLNIDQSKKEITNKSINQFINKSSLVISHSVSKQVNQS